MAGMCSVSDICWQGMHLVCEHSVCEEQARGVDRKRMSVPEAVAAVWEFLYCKMACLSIFEFQAIITLRITLALMQEEKRANPCLS